jgi:hypothetical protein
MSEVEVVDSVELVHQPIGQVSIYASTNPQDQLNEAKARAKVLFDVVKEQGLARTFGGNPKPHVQVEGWQFLGSQFGLIADIEWTKELEDGWEARAAIRRLSDGMVISHADAECRRSEGNWKNRDSYAIRSMAQTRATSKVFRNALSSVMVMAGFAGTPAEEMDGVHASHTPPQAIPVTTNDPHCPACLAVKGELVQVHHNQKKPFWKCTAGENCAGAEPDKNGKTWAWSGWHEAFRASSEEWLQKNGYEGTPVAEQPEVSPGQWMATQVQALKGWTKDQRTQAYNAVVDELEFREADGSVDLTLEKAKAIFEGMHASWLTEQEAPF